VSYVAGLDLGQSQDYSALAILETAGGRGQQMALRHLQRWDLGTPYPTIAADVETLLGREPLRTSCELIVDGTGVGRAVVDFLEDHHLTLIPVVITGGDTETHEGGWYRVPKRDLVGNLAVSFETDALHIAKGLALAPVLRKEVATFKAKISLGGHDSYEAWREQDHDDLVLAVALAVWWAKRGRPGITWIDHYARRAEQFEREAGWTRI
jgi:hypothetical protein